MFQKKDTELHYCARLDN